MKINLQLPVNTTGYGNCGLQIAKQFYSNKEYFPSLFPISNVQCDDQSLHPMLQELINRTNEFDYNAPCLKLWHQHAFAERIGKGPYYGLTFFEINKFKPVEKNSLESLDKLFVASNWAKEIVLSETDQKNVFVAPMGVDTETFFPSPRTSEDKPYIFFNQSKIEIRKGHDILCDLFNDAFDENDNVELHISWQNPFMSPQEHEEWEKHYLSSKLGSKIKFIKTKSQKELAEFYNNGDCGIFPTRAEGFGLGVLESIACNKPIITTKYSAMPDFCSGPDSVLIEPNGLENAYDGKWFMPGCGQWANLNDNYKNNFIETMRRMYEENIRTNREYKSTVEKFSWQNTYTSLVSCF